MSTTDGADPGAGSGTSCPATIAGTPMSVGGSRKVANRTPVAIVRTAAAANLHGTLAPPSCSGSRMRARTRAAKSADGSTAISRSRSASIVSMSRRSSSVSASMRIQQTSQAPRQSLAGQKQPRLHGALGQSQQRRHRPHVVPLDGRQDDRDAELLGKRVDGAPELFGALAADHVVLGRRIRRRHHDGLLARGPAPLASATDRWPAATSSGPARP